MEGLSSSYDKSHPVLLRLTSHEILVLNCVCQSFCEHSITATGCPLAHSVGSAVIAMLSRLGNGSLHSYTYCLDLTSTFEDSLCLKAG